MPRDEKQRDQVPHLFGPEFEDEIAAGSMKFVDLPKSLFKIFTIDYRFPSHGGLSIGKINKNTPTKQSDKIWIPPALPVPWGPPPLQQRKMAALSPQLLRWKWSWTPSQKNTKKVNQLGVQLESSSPLWVGRIYWIIVLLSWNIYIDLSACWTIHDLWLIFPPMNFHLEDKCHYCPDWLPIGYSHIIYIYIPTNIPIYVLI